MTFTNNLREGMTSKEVRAVKDKLFEKGYYSASVKQITHDRFGSDTTAAVKAFQKANGLEEDGIVGELTWGALFANTSSAPEEQVSEEKLVFTRNLKFLMIGEDVLCVKRRLFALGFYAPNVSKITNNRFGKDTVDAVKAFQKKYHLVEDGIVGKNTIAKLNELTTKVEPNTDEYAIAKDYPRLSEAARAAINEALKRVSFVRRRVVLEALKYATDASVAAQFDYPSSLYIRGGNLYNKNNTLNVITEQYLKGSYKQVYASYCTHGRLEMMINAVKADPTTTGCDCSGGIIGLFRHFGLIIMNTDATANGLCGSGYSVLVKKVDLTAGDFVGRDGHICLYVGGGYILEWAGGEYGCQLSNMNDHKCWSYTKRKFVKQKACTKYRCPKAY